MIEIQLGKKVVKLEDSLTVDQYQKLQTHKFFLENAKPSKLLSIYLNVDEKEIKNADRKQIEFIEQYVFKKLTENVTNKIVFTFEIEGITYGLENDWKKLAWGAWQDLEFLCSEDITQNIHKLLAVLYRPVTYEKGKNYKIEPYDSDTIDSRAELFKKAPVTIWFGCAQFFFSIATIYTNNIKNTLESEMKIIKWMKTGMKIIPSFLRKKLPLDSILLRQLNSRTTISPK